MTGLSLEEVEKRKKQGLVNGNFSVKTKSVGQIIYSNVFTLFNFINIFLAVCLVLVKSYKNMMFLGVVFWNILIGIVQEIRSKRIIDRLSLLSEPTVLVLRDGNYTEKKIEEIVLDDVFALKNGNQVCTDAVILRGECEVNESLLTGESDPVFKKTGDEILSGSFIISGNIVARAVHVGQDNYINKITKQAKYIKKPNSEIFSSIKKIIKIISIVLPVIICMLFYHQMTLSHNHLQDAVVSTVAAVIGMIPSGLVLLTSMVLAVSVIRLGRKKTLVQELYCIETLARVDTLCLDKTGTITEGCMDVDGVEILNHKLKKEQIDEILYFFTNGLNDDNPTFEAMKAYSNKLCKNNDRIRKDADYIVRNKISFSSDKKWSLVDFEKQGTYVIGALEFVFRDCCDKLKETASRFARDGVRVLIMAHSDDHCDGRHLPEKLEPFAFLLLTDRIRRNAPETLRYFKNQGVGIKVISGDQPETVANIAKRAGMEHWDRYVDATGLQTDEELADAAERYDVFGRVTPGQKLKIVQVLKEKGHTVAMTGDGVNDVMALKEADCSIAMQSGSDAARNVSQLILMDSDFAAMPQIVEEGRRTINNIQRSAALYLTKTIYSVVLALLFIWLPLNYPFQPIQLTLIGSLTIGIPSFILAMEPNLNRVKGNFLMNVLRLAIPGGLLVITNVMAAEIMGHVFSMSEAQAETLAFLGLAIASLVELLQVCKPYNHIRVMMCIILIGCFSVAVVGFHGFFEITRLSVAGILAVAVFLGVTPALHLTYSIMIGNILGNTPNVYKIYPVHVRKNSESENIILVDEDMDEKDYTDVAAQMLGIRVLKADKIAYIGKTTQGGHIRVDYADKKKEDIVLAAAAEYYVKRKLKPSMWEKQMEIMVETMGENRPVKVIVDLEKHRTIIEDEEENKIYRLHILKKIKLTL